MPLLSIIIPVYNNVSYISFAIENYLSQECINSELIIVDGGSRDGTKEVIENYSKKFPLIRWISEKDKGQSDAMNKGIAIAKGQYISFLNVDDFYSKGCLNQVCSILIENPSINYLVGNCNVWDQFDNLIYINKPSKIKLWHILSGLHFSVNPTSYFYKKKIHDIAGLYPIDNHYNMDLEMIIRFRKITKFDYYPFTWGNFRMLPNAKTFEDQASNMLQSRKDELLINYLNKQNPYIRFRVYLYLRYRKYNNQIVVFLKKIRDKIKFEIKKMTS